MTATDAGWASSDPRAPRAEAGGTSMQPTHHDVFVCYASEDKAIADAVVATLERGGVRCWIAPRDVVPGDSWAVEILNGIRGARLVVFVFSSHSNASPHVSRELERAVSEGLAVLPLRIEDVLPSGDLEYFISSAHWLDAMTPPLQAHLDRLLATVQFLIGQRGAVGPLDSSTRVAPLAAPIAPPGRRRSAGIAATVLLLVVALVAGAAVAVGVWRQGGSPPVTTVAPPVTSVTTVTTVTTTVTTTATSSPRRVPMDHVAVGDCFDGVADMETSESVVVVDCTGPHEAWYFAEIQYPEPDGVAYPGEDEAGQYSRGRCDTEYERQQPDPDQRQRYITEPVFPTETSWDAGDRRIECFAWERDALGSG